MGANHTTQVGLTVDIPAEALPQRKILATLEEIMCDLAESVFSWNLLAVILHAASCADILRTAQTQAIKRILLQGVA